MKKPTLLSTLGAWCARRTAQAQPAAPANPPASHAEATSEPADEILPLVQFEDAPLVDVIKTLARQAHLNIIIDPRIMAAGQTGKSRPVSTRLENTTAQKVLETVLNNNNLRLERDDALDTRCHCVADFGNLLRLGGVITISRPPNQSITGAHGVNDFSEIRRE